MKLKFMKNRKAVDGELKFMYNSILTLDLPYIASKKTGLPKYIDHRPLYTLQYDYLPKFYEGDGIATIELAKDNSITLIINATIKTIEYITEFPKDKFLVWVKSTTSDTKYYGYSKQMFSDIKYIPIYEEG